MTLSASSVLHYWDARYGSIPVYGGPPTFSRSSAGTWIDQSGIAQSAIVNTPRTEWAQLYGEDPTTPATLGKRRPVLRLEAAGTNVCLQSENFGTTWTAVGSPTRSAAAHTASGVTLDLIGDDDAATLKYYLQALTFTGDAVKAISVHVRQGTSTSSVVRIADQTAGAERLNAVVTWSAGVPSVSAGVGSYLGYESLLDGTYRLLLATTSITAANTNQIQIFPATSAGLSVTPTGTLYVGGVQAEDAIRPTSYVKTTTASATRAADSLYWTFTPAPQGMVIYTRWIETANLGIGGRVWEIGSSGDGSPRLLLYPGAGSAYRLFHDNGVTSVSSDAGAPAYGDTMESVAVINASGAARHIASVNGAAVTDGGTSATLSFAAAWADTRFWLNGSATQGPRRGRFAQVKIVKYADVVASTAQGIMDEIRSFALDSRQGVL